jgi:SAM-dependent methyltransferase
VCNESCVLFVARQLDRGIVQGRSVVELGSAGVGLRSLLTSWSPSRYVGVDIVQGPGVDLVCQAEDIVRVLPAEAFDVVLSTEMLEHVLDWRRVITNIKTLCAPGGRVVLTTRSLGYPYHSAPWDFWRYEVDDMRAIFADFAVHAVETDWQEPGVFVAASKPRGAYRPVDLSSLELHSMVTGGRTRVIPSGPLSKFRSARKVWRDRVPKFAKVVVETLRGRPPNIRFPPDGGNPR